MGMYTEFHFNAELKPDTPEDVLDLLRYMTGEAENPPEELPDHRLFNASPRWEYMLNCDSYYFAAQTHSRLYKDDLDENQHYLCVRCNLKNYKDEIESFVDWITPFVYPRYRPDRFLGFLRYEEDEVPTLIYYPNEFITPDIEIEWLEDEA